MKSITAIGAATLAFLLFSSALSWAEVKLIVVRKTTTNELKATVCDSGNTSPCTAVAVPIGTNFTSSVLPTLGWDDAGFWTIVGTNSDLSAWAGEITQAAAFTLVSGTVPQAPVSQTTNEPPLQQVSYAMPSTPVLVTCTYATSQWGPCQSDGLGGGVQYREVMSTSSSGCTGGTLPASSQSCTPPAPPAICSSWAYSAWSPSEATCTFGQTLTRSIVTSSPNGCTGGNPILTESCPNGAPTCTSWTYSAWSPSEVTCTAGQTLTRSIVSASPTSCTGGSPILTEACPNGSSSTSGEPAGTVTLAAQLDASRVTLSSGGSAYFKLTGPAGGCSPYGWLQVSLVSDSVSGGDGQLLVKSSNHGQASWPTLADYNYEFARVGYSAGQDWTRDSNGGAFFWTFSNGGAGENVTILKSYAGHTVDESDTFYVLLYNAGSASNGYRVAWRCY